MQFDLAWEIRKTLETEKFNDWSVEFEYLSAIKAKCENDNEKNIYTDLIIWNKNSGEFIPVELKYKTKNYCDLCGIQLLKNHGARDLGRFDYLWDLQRIQILRNGERNYCVSPNLKTMIDGFAIILTNDKDYWETTRESLDNKGKKPLYYKFCIGQEQIIRTKEMLNWKAGKSCVNGTWREKACPLNFDNEYICKWEECPNNEWNELFKCLILSLTSSVKKGE